MQNGLEERLARNPFYVLGLRPSASRAEIEREGQKLLAMLELGLNVPEYDTPLGKRRRSPEQIREALAELRDPAKRLHHELWARAPAETPAIDADPAHFDEAPPAWTDAEVALGWRRR
jgi:hypothetical protein